MSTRILLKECTVQFRLLVSDRTRHLYFTPNLILYLSNFTFSLPFTNYSVRHGGGRKCRADGCLKVARGKLGLCMSHATHQEIN
jgi:hypothetical protein